MEMKMREPISTAVDIPLDQIKVPRNRMRSLRPEADHANHSSSA